MIIREKNRDVVTDVIVCNSFITPNRCTRDFKSDISPNNPFPLPFNAALRNFTGTRSLHMSSHACVGVYGGPGAEQHNGGQ